jgi:hypothetical protein
MVFGIVVASAFDKLHQAQDKRFCLNVSHIPED